MINQYLFIDVYVRSYVTTVAIIFRECSYALAHYVQL